jgi:hypothetical protein
LTAPPTPLSIQTSLGGAHPRLHISTSPRKPSTIAFDSVEDPIDKKRFFKDVDMSPRQKDDPFDRQGCGSGIMASY